MSEANSSANSPSYEENGQEKSKNGIVLKDSNTKVLKTQARKVPAKANATRLIGSPPFSKEVYTHFVSSLKYGEPAYPTTKELRKLDFYSSSGTTHRKRFRKLLARFELHVVKGPLVFSSNLEEDVIVIKRTGKILVPREDVDNIIRRAHWWGSNEMSEELMDEKNRKHYNVGHTITIVSNN